MLKFREIGTYKNAVNVGYCVATVEMHNGQVAIFDEVAKTASHPATGKEAELAIVMNTIDKPETHSPNEYVIEVGENPRLFVLESLKGRILDMDTDQVVTAYADINVGDVLVGNANGKLEVAADATGYAASFEVIEKTSFNGEGLAVKVVIA